MDDPSFWPETYVSDNGGSPDGISAWIAVADMPAHLGGSMLVAPGSHTAAWRHEAYTAIGQDRTRDVPMTLQDLIHAIQTQTFTLTCDMHKHNPALRAQIEATKVVFDLQQGDVILAIVAPTS